MADRSHNPSRRDVLKPAVSRAGGAAAAPYVLTSSALGAADRAAASERVTMGFIGVGGMGNGDLGEFMKLPDVQVVAVCDVRRAEREGTKARVEKHYASRDGAKDYKGCAGYRDFRDLLGREDIDGVCIATPDHWHAYLTIAAAEAGKDMYVEKPMNVSVAQGRAMVQAVRKHDRRFQHGTQQRSDRKFRFACELALSGKLGKVHTIRVGTPSSIGGPVTQPQPVPEGFDYGNRSRLSG